MKKAIACLLLLANVNGFSAVPITPDKVFSAEEIEAIHESQNYFFYQNMDNTLPIWFHTNRKYGNHLLGSRTDFLNLEDVVHHILSDGFPIKLRLQELYRANLGIHARIGDILPQLNINLGPDLPGGISHAFSGLFGFLMPANWMNLANQLMVYKATRYLLVKDVMDEVLNAKIMYINQHQNITDFEILNYYFIHLQVLAQRYEGHDRVLQTLLAEFAVEGTDMASQRGNIKLGFDDLALIIALEKINSDYSVNTFNISEILNFPELVHDLDDLPELYKDKEKFLEEVIRRSVELKSIKLLYDVSKLNVGVVATGGTISNTNAANNPSGFNIAFKVGYGTLPNILIASSLAKTAEINVRSSYLKKLDDARRSFDFYTNSLGGYTEAKRAVEQARKSLNEHLRYLIENNQVPDALFILSLNQLIRIELKLNNALHGSLKALAYIKRHLLIDDLDVLKYLPDKDKILKYFNKVQREYHEETAKEHHINQLLSTVRSNQKLYKILYERDGNDNLDQYTDEEINSAIKRNIVDLLHNNAMICKKRKFFILLDQYIKEQKIQLTSTENLKLSLKMQAKCKKTSSQKNFYRTFDFEHFNQ